MPDTQTPTPYWDASKNTTDKDCTDNSISGYVKSPLRCRSYLLLTSIQKARRKWKVVDNVCSTTTWFVFVLTMQCLSCSYLGCLCLWNTSCKRPRLDTCGVSSILSNPRQFFWTPCSRFLRRLYCVPLIGKSSAESLKLLYLSAWYFIQGWRTTGRLQFWR